MLRRLIVVSILSSPALMAAPPVTQSQIDAVERRLSVEQAPQKRMQLLLRWISFKDELANQQIAAGGSEGLQDHKRQVIMRLRAELPEFEKAKAGDKSNRENLNILHRELGTRLLQVQDYGGAIEAYLRIQPRSSDDEMGLGDAHFGLGQTIPAMNAFERAALDPRLTHIAAYKRGWAYMRLSDFPQALHFFNEALKENPFNPVNLKEEAFKDRIRPFIETHKGAEFSELDFALLKALAENTFADVSRRQKNLIAALEQLIEGFNAKSQVSKSRNVFAFYTRESKDPIAVLLQSAPLWLKVYRGQLDHPSVLGILKELPEPDLLALAGSAEIRAELNNTALFYETLLEEERIAKSEKVPFYRGILLELYRRYFIAFRRDPDSDSLRISYATHLIQGGDAGACLALLSERSGQDEKLEEVSKNLEGKCELKYIDQLYLKEHDAFFFQKLEEALLTKKIYARSDLGVSQEQAFEGLAGMLAGSLKKNPSQARARGLLQSLNASFPYSKSMPIYQELQILAAELNFQDLAESAVATDESSLQFFKIFSTSPAGSEVAEKALQNAILSGSSELVLDYCKTYRTQFAKNFSIEGPVFKKCLLKAEEFHDLDEELLLLTLSEPRLSGGEKLRLGLLEMGLKKGLGRKRLVALRTQEAVLALKLWEGEEAPVERDDRLIEHESNVKDFVRSLKKVSFQRIQQEVPLKVRSFDQLDRQLVAFYKVTNDPIAQAQVLELRSLMALRMKEWMKTLPEPKGLKGEELEKYRAGAVQIVRPWEEGALARRKECSEVAYALSDEVKALDQDACPEAIPSEVERRFMDAWAKTRRRESDVQNARVRGLLAKAQSTTDRSRAQVLLLRALELSGSPTDQSYVLAALAERTGYPRFWRQAGELNGNLPGPIEWRLKRAEGNPFFTRLYKIQRGEVVKP